MSIVSCPVCSEKVTVPAGADGEARVRCPLCLEEYPLRDALAQLPPQLVIVESPAAVHSAPALGSSGPVIEVGDSGGDEIELAEVDEPPLPFQFEHAAVSRPVANLARLRRRQKSPGKEVFKIVAGGVVGLAIGQMLLWWWLDIDPLRFGPTVSGVAAWAVPARFHSENERADAARIDRTARSESTFDFVDDGDASRQPDGLLEEGPLLSDPGSATGFAMLEMGEETENEDSLAMQEGEPKTSLEMPATIPTIEIPARRPPGFSSPTPAGETEATSEVNSATSSDGSESSLQTASDAADDAETPSSKQPVVIVQGLPKLTPTDLADRLKVAMASNDDWDRARNPDAAETRRLARDFYRSLAFLGEVMTVVDQADPQVREMRDQIHKLLLDIAKKRKKADLVRKVAPSWLAADRPHDGVLIMGTVREIKDRGRLYETQFEIRPDQMVTVVSARDPRQSLQPESKAILLGLILEKPKESVAGYLGMAERVILDGFHVVP
jgi:hypothetical protein